MVTGRKHLGSEVATQHTHTTPLEREYHRTHTGEATKPPRTTWRLTTNAAQNGMQAVGLAGKNHHWRNGCLWPPLNTHTHTHTHAHAHVRAHTPAAKSCMLKTTERGQELHNKAGGGAKRQRQHPPLGMQSKRERLEGCPVEQHGRAGTECSLSVPSHRLWPGRRDGCRGPPFSAV